MPVKICLSSQLEGKDLIINISNSGTWVDPSEHDAEGSEYNGTGQGIQNAVNRLNIAYPDSYQLLFEKLSQKVVIKMVIRNIEAYE